jgi:hypothetical protein
VAATIPAASRPSRRSCAAQLRDLAGPGLFRAWLSTDLASPADGFLKSDVPYVRLDDVQVAADWQDLIDGTLDAPINVSELGGLPAMGTHACFPTDALVTGVGTRQHH